jgi:ABC-type bacteriocin/lantibiotic exporter with double-glycine peptidase domain
MSGAHQIGLCGTAVAVSLLDLAPVELQRRIIDDAIAEQDVGLLWQLGILYLIVTLGHQGLKFALRLYQGWVSESAVVHTRRHSLAMRIRAARHGLTPGQHGAQGSDAVVMGPEIDRLGGFVGGGVSDACANLSLLVGVFAYMAWTQPELALVSALLLAPQALFAPVLQKRLNRLMRVRFRLVRMLGARTEETPEAMGRVGRLLPRIYGNRLAIQTTKYGMKALLNLLNQLGPLAALGYGGWLVMQGETTVGVVVAFVSAFQRLAAPLRALLTFYRQWEQARVQHALVARWMAGEVG